MPPRTWKWFHRIWFGSNRMVALHVGQELWKWDTSRYESIDGIIAALRRAGRPFDDDSVLYVATSSLLSDVVDAAGGIEYANIRLHECLERAQDAHAGYSITHSLDDYYITDPDMEAAWYTVEELAVWARTLDERLKRAGSKGRADQGLIPALADGPRRDAVIAARSRLLNGGLREARWLSGLNLHMQPTQAGFKRGKIENGRIILPFPDRLTGRVDHRWRLTYDDGRDALSFADNLMESVATFMDATLGAFEEHLPERFRNI